DLTLHSFPTRRSSDLKVALSPPAADSSWSLALVMVGFWANENAVQIAIKKKIMAVFFITKSPTVNMFRASARKNSFNHKGHKGQIGEHTSELQSLAYL